MREHRPELENPFDPINNPRRVIDGDEYARREPPRVLLEVGHHMFLLPKGTSQNEAHAAAALLARSFPVFEDYYEENAAKFTLAHPTRIRFSLIPPERVSDPVVEVAGEDCRTAK